jgi:IS605 OrfB family transposase
MIQRTARVKLNIREEDESKLKETFKAYRQACQYTVDYAWQNRDENNRIKTSKKWLHEKTYEKIKDKTGLNSGLIQTARNQAVDSLKQVINSWKRGEKASKPEFKSWFIAYDDRTLTYTENGCTLATVEDRVKAEFITSEGDNPQSNYLSQEWNRKQATLHHENGDFYLHVTVAKEVEEAGETESGKVLGVDLNVKGSLAVTSTGCFIGSSDYVNHKRDNYEEKRGSLQEKGTRSAHKTLRKIGRRFSRWSEQLLHEYANTLLEEAVEYDCSTIVFEDLEGIRENISNDKKFQQWAFYKFYKIVEYKAEEYGISVEQESPEYTSQTCSYCGYVDSKNRKGKSDFECQECGREYHADYNAARNIGLRFVRSGQKSQHGRANCQLALKSGTLKLREGEKLSTCNESEAEYTDKPLLFKER